MNTLIKGWKSGNDTGLLVLRVVCGLVLFYGHGSEKLAAMFSGNEIQFMDPIGIGSTLSFFMASFAEIACALLLITGLFTHLAALILVFNFIVIFIFHAFIVGDGFSVLELRFLYLFSFVTLFFTGAGKFSLDYLFFVKEK